MANEFVFKSGVKTLDIKNEDGKLLLTLSVNVGDKEQTKKWMTELQDVQKVSNSLSDDNVEVLDELEALEKKIISSILGAEKWAELWGICGHNVFSMLAFVRYLSDFLNETMKGFYQEYV